MVDSERILTRLRAEGYEVAASYATAHGPYPHVDRVIELMADGRVLPYLDIPFQHASARILKLQRTAERVACGRRGTLTVGGQSMAGGPAQRRTGDPNGPSKPRGS